MDNDRWSCSGINQFLCIIILFETLLQKKKNKSESFVKKIFAKYEHKTQWTIKRFYLYQLKLKESVNHYVNEDTLSLLN